MTYTTDQAIALAVQAGAQACGESGEYWYDITPEELTALCNKVREQTLLEAAEVWETIGYSKFRTPAEELRRMAGVE